MLQEYFYLCLGVSECFVDQNLVLYMLEIIGVGIGYIVECDFVCDYQQSFLV